MQINVTGRQFVITPAIQTQAENVLAVLDIPALRVTSVNAVMSREKNHFQVSLVLNCKYHTLKAEVEDFDLYRALDAAADKLEAQCRDLKEKMQDHQAAALSEVETENGQTE
ncbi:MAG: ribosome-associated translation inhibitor RaiA [Lentisphaerae bacterium]|nr:ribosome-associated translation inhibitor RaiA [Lentisphaerota bacterium]